MKKMWNDRYKDQRFAYGEEPNVFFKEKITQFPVGNILLPAEGEGRNAVYAAKLGWEVSAFDLSEEGKAKAETLASKNGVEIKYHAAEFSQVTYQENQFDVIGLIYAHFPADLKSAYHQQLDKYLKPGGIIIFEAFSKSHLQFNLVDAKAGGPKNVEMLFSVEELKHDFPNYEIIQLTEEEIQLNEGLFHQGKSSVIRFVGKKK